MHKGQIKWNGLNSKLEDPDGPKSDLKVAELRGGPKHVNNHLETQHSQPGPIYFSGLCSWTAGQPSFSQQNWGQTMPKHRDCSQTGCPHLFNSLRKTAGPQGRKVGPPAPRDLDIEVVLGEQRFLASFVSSPLEDKMFGQEGWCHQSSCGAQ